jgi:hypothetical protein
MEARKLGRINFSSIDLYYINQCSKRWFEEISRAKKNQREPQQELLRKVFLMKSIGREYGWNFKGIAALWDRIFWSDRDVNRKTIRESAKSLMAIKSLYNRVSPGNNVEPYSVRNLDTFIDSTMMISSAGDFLLSYPDRYETWIYMDTKKNDIIRSPLLSIEHYLIQQSIRDFHQKEFHLVIYYMTGKRKKGSFFRIKSNFRIDYNRKVVLNLATRGTEKIVFPSGGGHCKDCSLDC